MYVFFSYAQQDEYLAQQFLKYFALVQAQRDIQFGHHDTVSIGKMHASVVTTLLEQADLVLLFITPDFIASSRCYESEMPQALALQAAGKAQVIPMLVRPVVAWEHAPFGKLPVLPQDGKPITTWNKREKAWVTLIEQMQELLTHNQLVTEPETCKAHITYAHVTLDPQCRGWGEEAQSLKQNLALHHARRSFALGDVASPSDPAFDITLLNTTPRPVLLTRVGIVIETIAHTSTLSPLPRAVAISVDRLYTLPMPPILSQSGPFEDEEPLSLHQIISMDLPDPIYLPAHAPYRYSLLLADYCQHMPQETDFSLWLQTNSGQEQSSLLHLSLRNNG